MGRLKARATREQERRSRTEHEKRLRETALARFDATRAKRDTRVQFRAVREVVTGDRILTRSGQLIKWLAVNSWAGIVWFGFSSAILYRRLDIKYPLLLEFVLFWMISNAVTVFQLVGMPLLKSLLTATRLVDTNFQVFQVGTNLDGTPYFIFDYAAGPLTQGGGGGLAYFLAVTIVLFLAQVINFPLQRNIAFKSKGNPWRQAPWFFLAFVAITLFAGAAQGLYKAPLYNLLINTWNMGPAGEATADVLSMFIYAIISFWVYFPIFKIIFPRDPRERH